MTTIELAFGTDEAREAYKEYGFNCGPAALAAILGLTPGGVRAAVEAAGFAERRYMNPTMMKAALRNLGVKWHANKLNAFTLGRLAFPAHGIARIQWEGPWTGANPKWACLHTHWVASWKHMTSCKSEAEAVLAALSTAIFDINGGLMDMDEWEAEVVPRIIKSIPRANGDWHVTHSFEILTS